MCTRMRCIGIGALLTVLAVVVSCSENPAEPQHRPPPEALATTAAVTGTTQAPDLQTVGNFRKGNDVNGSGEKDTYVDFTFDQAAAVVSCCAGFQLVPTDGGAPVAGLSVVSGDGSTTLTVAFEGKIKASTIARGTVDRNIVRVDGSGSETNNPPQAAAVSNSGNTSDPDLVSVTRDGDQLLFEFDEALTQEDVIQNTSGLRFYTPQAETFSSSNVRRQAGTDSVLRAIYDLPSDVTLEDAVGGYVIANTVADADSDDNVNELDEVAPLNDTGAVVCAAAPETGETGSGAGPTEAPDLMSIGNFRRGPYTDEFNPTTCVDFVFDSVAYLNGGTTSNFHLVPLDGGDALDGSTNQMASADSSGDRVITIVFPGEIVPDSFARGYVDSEVLGSQDGNASADAPLNINQAADISPNTATENPDLAAVKRDGDTFLFEFDEPLTDDDVIQNSSGLRLYFPEAKQTSAIPFADSDGVEEVNDSTLRAFFNTYPADYGPGDAVGGYVVQGTVQAVADSRGGNAGVNAFDELTPIEVIDASTCEPAPSVGGTGDGSGPTDAPDLLSVGNFREGPYTSQFEPTTCVDFTFDQVAYLNGGDKSNFAIVPLDAGDALFGSTNVTLSSSLDPTGDQIVTIVFPGQLDPADYARGFVTTGVVNSASGGASQDDPYNINQAADIAPNVATENPDLVSVRREGSSFLFEFDEPLTDDDLIQNSSGLRIYFPAATQSSTIPFAGSDGVEEVNDSTLRAFYNTYPGSYEAADAVGAYVVQGTVQAVSGSRGGNSGMNAFDELTPIEVVDSVTCEPAPDIGGSGDGSGPTEAPDLLSVGNFRDGPFTSQFEPTTCVDFVFDQQAYLNGGDKSNFALVPLDAGDAIFGSTNVTLSSDKEIVGDQIVTVVFPGDISPADFARGFVTTGVVNSAASNTSTDNPLNINQAAAITPNTATENPDLVAVKRDGDAFLFEFDEPLTSDDVAQNSSGLRLYFPQAKQQSTIPEAASAGVEVVNDSTLRAFYNTYPADYRAEDAVGGFVDQGSVQAAVGSRGGNSGVNAFDELTPITVIDSTTCAPSAAVGGTGDGAGPTEAPDLMDVGNFREGPYTTQFEPTTCVDFTFDQVAYLNGGDRSNFALVPLDAGDAVFGSTNTTPRAEWDPAGDNIITVIFIGDISPADFARGYITTGVVNSDASNISADNPLNINQAANIDPNTLTENPDLVQDLDAVERQSEIWLYFVFDEALTDDDIVQSTSGLRIYFPATSQASTIPDAGAIEVGVVNDSTLRAKFKDLPEGYKVSDAVGAFVVQGTVQAAVGSRGANDGKSAFDETFLSISWPDGG